MEQPAALSAPIPISFFITLLIVLSFRQAFGFSRRKTCEKLVSEIFQHKRKEQTANAQLSR
jgi:hypothetical protein